MNVALVGGIYGKDESFRRSLQVTPEIVLEQGFRDRGHRVQTASHHARIKMRMCDVIHVHHLGYGALRAGSDSSRTPFVYTSHDGAAMVGLEASKLKLFFSRWIMARADAVIALSQAEATFQQRTYSLAGAVHEVIPNGIEAKRYPYERRNAAGKGRAWQLLYVGQLVEQKRVDLLLRAMALAKVPVELKLAYHNAACEIPLRRMAAELRLSDRVRFLGPKEPKDLSTLYQEADLFVQPSTAEALPSVVTEAMLSGTPIVAADVGGVREQLGGYGVVVCPGQSEALAAGIAQVIEDYEHFASESRAMSTRARRNFSIENMVENHLELYTKLIRRRWVRRHTALRAPVNALVKMGVDLLCATK